ncbi:Gfo/Idh/MocA family protein [Treponema primitia]|uniref:Gfo/Idh/MocA family protein n=1 Tax=Treponema primitia TaxID=88058 RepID=UPI0002554FFD|nr:Gfo/Idh/MocA family oxidoreductase [Treponema primitia]
MIEGSADAQSNVKLRYGMVGGGQGAFIGDVHRKSIALDGLAEITAGCFSRSTENTLATGLALGIARDRLYNTYEEMAEEEAKRTDRIDFAVIVTPNYSHYPAAKAFLSRGIPVVCDKPLCVEEAEARELANLAKSKNLLFMVSYTYSGNPTVKHARELIRRGDIGKVHFINGEYPQEWLLTDAEKQGSKQAEWRTDPKLAGKSNSLGDLGTHIEHTVSYLTGLRIKSVCARMDKIMPGRILDDNATVMLEYEGGAKGIYWTSQVASGYDNALRVRIFGSKGSIEFFEEESNYVKVSIFGKPTMVLSRGRDPFFPHAQSFSRIPSGHPEGYFEALGNLYKTYIKALIKQREGKALTEEDLDFPNAEAGFDGVRFIGKCVESSASGAVWVNF